MSCDELTVLLKTENQNIPNKDEKYDERYISKTIQVSWRDIFQNYSTITKIYIIIILLFLIILLICLLNY